MEPLRKPYQGVFNIIRFNWHFYVIAGILFAGALFLAGNLEDRFSSWMYIIVAVAGLAILFSLVVSWYIYDWSDLYDFTWLEKPGHPQFLINIHAGFDETSRILACKFPSAELQVLDFYDPGKHTEISIERARKAYPPFIPTIRVETNTLPFPPEKADKIFLILSAHEIRNDNERQYFFREIHRILKLHGEVYVLEHLRNIPNFLAYNIGFLHFHSRKTWLKTFSSTGFIIRSEVKQTQFLTLFTLCKNGTTL